MKCNVAVTGLNATDNPAPGVAVIRSLREEPEWSGRIVGLAYDAYDPGIFDSELVDAVYLLPYPKAGRQVWFERMMEIQAKESIDVLIPNLDSELANVIDLETKLREIGIRTFLPSAAQLKRRTKTNLADLATGMALGVPESRTVASVGEAERAAGQLEFPLMVKGLFYEAYLAANQSHMRSAMHSISSRWGFPLILQKYVPGEEYNLAGLGDGRGGLVSAVCMKKVFTTDKGKGWAGVSIVNEELTNAAERFVSLLEWKGGFELEMLMGDDGTLYLIEINPRFPAWIYLGKACGINLPYAYCQLALGTSPAIARNNVAGTMFVHYTTDLVAHVHQLDMLLTKKELRYR
ncbi:MAG: ATP-grasp domain-containing protein [Ignavibacteria bacterium]|nr:ATP-grasp domain-containing protein [Ignavibacteria bacterium]